MPLFSYPKNKLKVVLLESIHPKAVDIFQKDGYTNIVHLASALQDDQLLEQIHDASIIGIRSNTFITKDLLKQCHKLIALGCFCIGTNQVDLQGAMTLGIPVFNDTLSNTRSVAELTIGFCVALMRDIVVKNASMHTGKWQKTTNGACEIRGKTMGIVGYGRIGSQVSILAESLGMQVVYFDPEQKLSLGNARPAASLAELLQLADVVTLHVPECSTTIGMIGAKELSLMKSSAYLINTCRGKVVDHKALAAALKNHTIKGAAIDVFHEEPKSSSAAFESPFQALDNIILTPHIAGATEEAQERIATCMATKLLQFVNHGDSIGTTNFPALALPVKRNTHRILHIHTNLPGVLLEINRVFAERKINIIAQYLQTNGQIGYVVFDIDKGNHEPLMESLKAVKGTIRARMLF